MTERELVAYRMRIWECLEAEDAEAVREGIGRVLAEAVGAEGVVEGGDEAFRTAHRVRLPSGRVLRVVRARPLSRQERRTLRILGREAERVFAVLDRVKAAVEGERHRQAVWLHQGPAQALTDALLALRLYRQGAASDAARELLDQAVERVQRAVEEVRGRIRALKSPDAAFVGIDQAVRATWEQVRPMTQARLVLDLEHSGPLPLHVEEGIAAVACEAITNAARHARASRIEVRLRRVRGAVVLEVWDDGRGMDGSGLRRTKGSFGLALMREQVARLRGRLRIRSGPQGTRVRVAVPLGVRALETA